LHLIKVEKIMTKIEKTQIKKTKIKNTLDSRLKYFYIYIC